MWVVVFFDGGLWVSDLVFGGLLCSSYDLFGRCTSFLCLVSFDRVVEIVGW